MCVCVHKRWSVEIGGTHTKKNHQIIKPPHTTRTERLRWARTIVSETLSTAKFERLRGRLHNFDHNTIEFGAASSNTHAHFSISDNFIYRFFGHRARVVKNRLRSRAYDWFNSVFYYSFCSLGGGNALIMLELVARARDDERRDGVDAVSIVPDELNYTERRTYTDTSTSCVIVDEFDKRYRFK